MIAKLLTIAGSDSSGGAGIQADLKTFSALGGYGMSVLTALTAQNTLGVHAVHPVPPEFVRAQIDAVLQDIPVDALKLGMLANAEIVEVIATALQHYRPPCVVLDTVMFAKGGHALLAQNAVAALREQLLPLADLITPNLPEAAALLGQDIAQTESAMRAQGEALLKAGARAVLMKGGHLTENALSPDWLITPQGEERFCEERVATHNTHGTGCTLSAALCALYPRHHDWFLSMRQARCWLQGALRAADTLHVGKGIGPVHHFHTLWSA